MATTPGHWYQVSFLVSMNASATSILRSKEPVAQDILLLTTELVFFRLRRVFETLVTVASSHARWMSSGVAQSSGWTSQRICRGLSWSTRSIRSRFRLQARQQGWDFRSPLTLRRKRRCKWRWILLRTDTCLCPWALRMRAPITIWHD